MLCQEEIEEIREVDGVLVRTPSGWKRVTHACRTVPMEVFLLKAGRFEIEAAGKHLVGVPGGDFVHVSGLRPGDVILTEDGEVSVESVCSTGERKNLYDLRIEGPDHCYFSNGILSHNSTGIATNALFRLNVIPRHHGLYVAPMKEHVKTFADKLALIEMGSAFPKQAKKGLRTNLYYKESKSGGSMRMAHVMSDVTKIRGLTIDHLDLDEAQNFNPDLIYEIEITMKDSEFASSNIAGTSLDKSTYLEQSYQAGSRGVWMIPNHAGKWYSLGDPEHVKQLLHVDGLKCPITKKLLNPADGSFIHESPRMIELGRPSFHLPQIIVPAYARGVKWLEIYRDWKDPHISETQFMREVMGIPTEDGLQELTEAHLKACCDPNLTFDKLQAELKSGKANYAFVSSGCDWGGSDPKVTARLKLSYTVHVMLGVRPSGMMDFVFAKRHPSKDYREIGSDIVRSHVGMKGTFMSTDNGGGNYYNVHIRDSGGIPLNSFLVYNYSDSLKGFLSPIDHPSFNLYSLARTDSLTMLFEAIKAKRIRFPRWEESSVYLNDLLNIVRNITSSEATGRKVTRYVRVANRADDTAHALNYALTTARIALHEPGIPDAHVVRQLQLAANSPIAPAYEDSAWNGYSDIGYFSE